MSWFTKKFEKFRRLPLLLMFTHVLGKFVFGVGLGVLLAFYLPKFNWQLWGWLLIVLSIIIAVPSLIGILKEE